MKIIAYILVGILVIVFLFQLMSLNSTAKTEMYEYKVLKKIQNIEIREYTEALFIQTSLPEDRYEKISSTGFRVLAGYIFGNNESNEKIAMTSPVVMDMGTNRNMYFMVPKNYTRSTLPNPNDRNIDMITKSKHRVAAISFSGWADESKIQKHIQELKAILDKEGIKHTNKFQFMGYNPPYELVNRRNEVVVEIL